MYWQDPRTGEAVERDLWVTRKGATPAREGQLGLIPGSMGAPLIAKQPQTLVFLQPIGCVELLHLGQ